MINQRLPDIYNLRPGLGRTRALAALIIPFACASCFFATKSDFDKLQQDVVVSRASSNASDSVQRAYLVEVTRTVRTLNDSINALSRRVNTLKTATEADMAAMKEDISQLQDLSGQSEQRLRDMRAAVEEKTAQPEPAAVDSGASSAGAAGGPGPAQLLQAGRDQLLKGGNVAARAAFSELITKYPRSDLVPGDVLHGAGVRRRAQQRGSRRTVCGADQQIPEFAAGADGDVQTRVAAAGVEENRRSEAPIPGYHQTVPALRRGCPRRRAFAIDEIGKGKGEEGA